MGRRGDVAVLEFAAGLPLGIAPPRLRLGRWDEDRPFSTHGFPDGHPDGIGAHGVIKGGLRVGVEWAQLEVTSGRRLTRGYSGAPVLDDETDAVVGMAVAEDAADPTAGIAAMIPLAKLVEYWPRLADELPSRLTDDPALDAHWDPRARGVEQKAKLGWFFTGRRQALTELVDWLTAAPDPMSNLRVVTGGPGSGKSAVLARLVTLSDPRYRSRLPPTLAPDDPTATLPTGVIDVAVHARKASSDFALRTIADAAGVSATDPEGLSNALLERQQAFAIVVDALDEADDPPKLAHTLGTLASETADAGVRLLVGTRPGGPSGRLLSALGLSRRADDPALIDLDTADYLSLDDLTEYVRRLLLLVDVPPDPKRRDTPYRGRESLAAQVAQAIARKAYPTFLIGQLVSRALLRRPQPLTPDDKEWERFPDTVENAMGKYLASFGTQQEQDRVKDLLRPLAYARGDGLPLDDDVELWPRLATALAGPGRSYNLVDVRELLDTAADYLIETVITGEAAYYRLYHQALADRLREGDHRRPIASPQTIFQSLLGAVPRRADNRPNWLAAHPYLQAHLAGHAADAHQLPTLLNDPEFLVAADPASLFGVLQQTGQPQTSMSQVYRQAYAHLRPGSGLAGERASYLQLSARWHGADAFAEQLDQLPLTMPWKVRWIRGRLTTPHYILGRFSHDLTGLAIGKRSGRTVVIAGGIGEGLRVWDLDTAEPVFGPLPGHRAVKAVAVGERAGRSVIVSGGGYEGTVQVWDLETGELVLGPLTGHSYVGAVAVGERAGRSVIVGGGDYRGDAGERGGMVRVWDLETGELVLGPLTGHSYVGAVAVGERAGRPVIILIGGGDAGERGGMVRVWDLETGELVLGPLTGQSYVGAVAVGERAGRSVIVSGGDYRGDGGYAGMVGVWDLETGELVLEILTGLDAVGAVAVGERAGRSVIVSGGGSGGGYEGTVRVWDLETGELVFGPLTGHDGSVIAVAASERAGQSVLISGGHDGTVRVWDDQIADEPASNRLTSQSGSTAALAVGRRARRTVLISRGLDAGERGGVVRVWDLETGELVLGPLTGHSYVGAVAVGERAGRSVIVSGGGYAGMVGVWDLETGERVLEILTGHSYVGAVAVGERAGRSVIVGGGDYRGDAGERGGMVRVWDLETGELVLGPLTGQSYVGAVAVGERAGRPVIISGGDYTGDDGSEGTVWVWDLETGERVPGILHTPLVAVYSIAVGRLAGRSILVSGGPGDQVWICDLDTGELVFDPLTRGGKNMSTKAVAVEELAGRLIVAAGGGRKVEVFELGSLPKLMHSVDLGYEIDALVLAGSGALVLGTTGGTLRVDLQ